MVQSPSWEANWFAASQEIPRISRNPKIRHLSLSWASPIQSIYPHPNSWRSILILSTHLRLGLPSGLLPFGFPNKTLYTPSPHPYAPHTEQNYQLKFKECTESSQRCCVVQVQEVLCGPCRHTQHNRRSFHGSKAVGVQNWPLASIQCTS